MVLNRIRNGSFFAGLQEFGPVADASQYVSKENIKDGADGQRPKNRPVGISRPGFLVSWAAVETAIKTDKCEKYDACSSEHSADTVLHDALNDLACRLG